MAVLSPEALARIPRTTRVLEIGVGQAKRVAHATALDNNPRTVADIIHDLDIVPFPFEDDRFDIIIAEHVLEHVRDLVRVMEELHRIAAPGAIVYVEVPHFSSANFYTDPTHRHAFSTRSFDYFDPDTELGRYRYSTAVFRARKSELGFLGRSVIQRMLNRRALRNPVRYEQKYAFIYPAERINFELVVVK